MVVKWSSYRRLLSSTQTALTSVLHRAHYVDEEPLQGALVAACGGLQMFAARLDKFSQVSFEHRSTAYVRVIQAGRCLPGEKNP
jgi:hypothetical protein